MQVSIEEVNLNIFFFTKASFKLGAIVGRIDVFITQLSVLPWKLQLFDLLLLLFGGDFGLDLAATKASFVAFDVKSAVSQSVECNHSQVECDNRKCQSNDKPANWTYSTKR